MRMAQIMRRLAQLLPGTGLCNRVPIEVFRGLGFQLAQCWPSQGEGDSWGMFWADGKGNEIEVLQEKDNNGLEVLRFIGTTEGGREHIGVFTRFIHCSAKGNGNANGGKGCRCGVYGVNA